MKKYFLASLLAFLIILQTSCSNGNITVPASTPLPSVMPTATLTATVTPQPKELWGKPSYSPNGKWVASRYKFSEGLISFLSFSVERLDGSSVWEIETIPLENKPPYMEFPAPFLWSKDNKTFYYVDQGFQDGCFTYWDGGKKLYSLNLDNGERKIILDEFASEIKFSPDESKIAYVNFGNTGLQMLDLQNGNKIEFEHLYPDTPTDQFSLVWSPDGNKLAFTVLLNPCDINIATSIAIIDISKNHQQMIVSEDERQFHTKEWINSDKILVVSDWSDNPEYAWHLDVKTGKLTSVNQ